MDSTVKGYGAGGLGVEKYWILSQSGKNPPQDFSFLPDIRGPWQQCLNMTFDHGHKQIRNEGT